jgi:1,2-diacylglycerol 3-alpha-glucosyltransferase
MRIAMFTDTWLPTIDGIVISIQRFKKGLEKRGHEVFIFAPEDRTGKLGEDDHTFLFKAKNFGPYPEYRMALFPSIKQNSIIMEHDIQMLHNHGVAFMGLKSLLSSRKLELPLLLHFHTWVTDASQYYPFKLNEKVLTSLSWRYLRPLCRRSDGVVAPSKSAIDELKRMVPGMRYTNNVSPGVDFAQFNTTVSGRAVRERLGLEDNEMLLHVGRVSREKNLELVFDALPQVMRERPGAKLVIVGDGPAKSEYEGMVRQRGLERDVLFTGFVSNDILPQYYAAADAFVLASKFETLGIVMTEALATGTPVAGVNFRVVPELIKDGYNGHLFEPKPDSCARGILKTLDASREMQRNAVESSKRFNEDDCMSKLERIYNDVVEMKNARLA